ncbi:MAG TPA: hypothetical protein VGC54_04375 [Planctomycetota bacterium]
MGWLDKAFENLDTVVVLLMALGGALVSVLSQKKKREQREAAGGQLPEAPRAELEPVTDAEIERELQEAFARQQAAKMAEQARETARARAAAGSRNKLPSAAGTGISRKGIVAFEGGEAFAAIRGIETTAEASDWHSGSGGSGHELRDDASATPPSVAIRSRSLVLDRGVWRRAILLREVLDAPRGLRPWTAPDSAHAGG